MSYSRMSSHKVPRLYPGQRQFERRIDERTAGDIGDALRADGVQAAALAMQHLQVDVQVALRVLAGTKEGAGKSLRSTDPRHPGFRVSPANAGRVLEPGARPVLTPANLSDQQG